MGEKQKKRGKPAGGLTEQRAGGEVRSFHLTVIKGDSQSTSCRRGSHKGLLPQLIQETPTIRS